MNDTAPMARPTANAQATQAVRDESASPPNASTSSVAPAAQAAPTAQAAQAARDTAILKEAALTVEQSRTARVVDCPCGCNREETACLFDTMPDEELLYDLADLFKVFADTTRIKILYALMERERCVADIAEIVGATQSAVSHQLRVLKQARLVKFQRDGKNVIYSLSDNHVYTMLAQGMTHICE